MEKPTPALIETPLQGRASASQTGATGQASLLPISQTRCGDLDNLLREPSNFDNPEIRILIAQAFEPKFGSWRFGIGVEVACGMVDGIKSLV